MNIQTLKISPSSMGQFEKCPFQWKCKRIDKREEVATDPTARNKGNNVHGMIDTYFKECPDKPTPKEIEELVWKIFERDFNRSLQHVKKDIEKCMRNFIQFEQNRLVRWKTYKPTFTERTLKNDRYLCIVDFHNDEEGITIDWKTGKMASLYDSNYIQAKINQIVLKDNGFNSKQFLFVNLTTGRTFEVPQVSDAWVDMKRDRMIRSIKKGDYPKKRSPLCKWCGFPLDCELHGVCLWL